MGVAKPMGNFLQLWGGFKTPIYGCFQKIGVPQNGWYIMENPIKMDDLGGKTLFLETPISQSIFHSPNLPTGGSVKISASRPGCHNRPDSTRTRHPQRDNFCTRFFQENFPPPVEADPRVEYNFLGMASNGPVEQ